ncbi:MAG: hypothetical protein F4Y89_11445 [Gammaproteobacteria bacterium]|nr:hypothetical protein [Gammaproteobacteria bacterium]MYG97512.1 hypothetical protein [Gammaproteobacteria bacterium]
MQVVLLRVGIDTGSGGIHGPLFRDGSFEYLPIPDNFGNERKGVDERTYGNTKSRRGEPLVSYFPERLCAKMRDKPMHFDPEFESFTYGDPVRSGPKRSLAKLEASDILVFYAGLKGFDFDSSAALHIIGYFEVTAAGFADEFSRHELNELFVDNFHVRHQEVFQEQRDRLILVKGGGGSRLLHKAVRISALGKNRAGGPLQRLSPEMEKIFGHFNGKTAIQRSTPRRVFPEFTERAAKFVRTLE